MMRAKPIIYFCVANIVVLRWEMLVLGGLEERVDVVVVDGVDVVVWTGLARRMNNLAPRPLTPL
jgi:hypothetical protein